MVNSVLKAVKADMWLLYNRLLMSSCMWIFIWLPSLDYLKVITKNCYPLQPILFVKIMAYDLKSSKATWMYMFNEKKNAKIKNFINKFYKKKMLYRYIILPTCKFVIVY